MSLTKRLAKALQPLRRRLSGLSENDWRMVIARHPAPEGQRYFHLGPDAALVRLNAGPLILVDPHDQQISLNIIAHGVWEEWVTTTVMSLLRPGARVVEVGANLGYYTLTMADRVGPRGRVTTLEANPRLAAMVVRSSQLSGLDDRVTVVAKAAMDVAGTVDFVTSRAHPGGGHVSPWADSSVAGGERFQVEAVRLDDLDLGRVDLIRIDAEGSEPFILRGAEGMLRANPGVRIVMEWSVVQMGSRTSVPDLVAWLSGLGFGFWKIEFDSGLTPVEPEALLGLPDCDLVLSRTPPRG